MSNKNDIIITVDNNGAIQRYKGESFALLMFTAINNNVGMHFCAAADEMQDMWLGLIYQAVESLGFVDVVVFANRVNRSIKKERERDIWAEE